MTYDLILKILREIASPDSRNVFSRREAARSAADLIERQSARITELEAMLPADPAEMSALLAASAPTPSDKQEALTTKRATWIERWQGSEPQRGWSIFSGRDAVAYIGGDESMSEAVSAIVAAHNTTVLNDAAAPPAQSAEQDRIDAEPTEAMLNAARDWSIKKYGQAIGSDAAIGCWKAMHAAKGEGK